MWGQERNIAQVAQRISQACPSEKEPCIAVKRKGFSDFERVANTGIDGEEVRRSEKHKINQVSDVAPGLPSVHCQKVSPGIKQTQATDLCCFLINFCEWFVQADDHFF